MIRSAALGLLLFITAVGCGSESQTSSPPSSTGADETEETTTGKQPALSRAGQECFDAWNAASNGANRDQVAGAFAVASVSMWNDDAGGGSSEAEPETGHEFEGCSYLFHDDEEHLTFSGRWESDGLHWEGQPQGGPWSPEQEAAVEDSAAVAEDGTLTFDPED